MIPPILCCGPTPALQRSLRFTDWSAPGDVVRTSHTEWSVGGKATNAARAITRGGAQATLLSPTGGLNGQRLRTLLHDEGLDALWVDSHAETRICETLMDSQGRRIRELVEDAAPLTHREWGELFAQAERALNFHSALLLCGSLPREAPVEVYATLTKLAVAARRTVILDAKGSPLHAALPFKPDLVKINRQELQATTGEEDIPTALRALQNLGAHDVMITDGPRDAWLTDKKRIHRFSLPQIDPINPIGGGDTVTGILALSLLNGASLPDAAREALGAGMAQTLTSRPADFDPAKARSLARKIKKNTVKA